MELNDNLTLKELREARAKVAWRVEEVLNEEIKAFYEKTHLLPEIDVSVGMSIGLPPHYFVTVTTEV